ncbi:hypothetical protein ACJX0J_035833 [Zea mays]
MCITKLKHFIIYNIWSIWNFGSIDLELAVAVKKDDTWIVLVYRENLIILYSTQNILEEEKKLGIYISQVPATEFTGTNGDRRQKQDVIIEMNDKVKPRNKMEIKTYR